MTVGSLDRATVELLPGTLDCTGLNTKEDPEACKGALWLAQKTDMTLFKITGKHLVKENNGVRMWVKMQRKPLTEILTTYLPSILLLLITFATTMFKPFFFEAALTVNLTNMLVMTTIFIGVMQSLPTTAYVKMIDLWLIGCQLVPFIEVVLLTAMEFHREGDGSGGGGEKEPITSKITTESQTATVNHHGASCVVQLGRYREEGTAAPAALATVEEGPATRPSTSTPHSLEEEEEKARQQSRKYIERIKYFGEHYNNIYRHV
jgi:hypothetical protein